MSTSSNKNDWCNVSECSHMNNKHKYKTCEGANCQKQWKCCQMWSDCNDVHYRICKKYNNYSDSIPDY